MKMVSWYIAMEFCRCLGISGTSARNLF